MPQRRLRAADDPGRGQQRALTSDLRHRLRADLDVVAARHCSERVDAVPGIKVMVLPIPGGRRGAGGDGVPADKDFDGLDVARVPSAGAGLGELLASIASIASVAADGGRRRTCSFE